MRAKVFPESKQHSICMALWKMRRKDRLPPLRIDAREIRLAIGDSVWHRISWEQAERLVNGEDPAKVSMLLGRGPFAGADRK